MVKTKRKYGEPIETTLEKDDQLQTGEELIKEAFLDELKDEKKYFVDPHLHAPKPIVTEHPHSHHTHHHHSLVKMRHKHDPKATISHGGVTYFPNEHGVVHVPVDVSAVALGHGFETVD